MLTTWAYGQHMTRTRNAAWTTYAILADGHRTAYDAPTKKAALRYFVEFIKAGTTCELVSPAGHVHNAYRSETGAVVVEPDGSYHL